jgi:hypothetical protein
LIILLNFLALAAIFVPLERVFPARPAQRLLRRGLLLDLCFFVGQYLITLSLAFSAMSLVAPHVRLADLGSSPAWMQVGLAIVLGDFVV